MERAETWYDVFGYWAREILHGADGYDLRVPEDREMFTKQLQDEFFDGVVWPRMAAWMTVWMADRAAQIQRQDELVEKVSAAQAQVSALKYRLVAERRRVPQDSDAVRLLDDICEATTLFRENGYLYPFDEEGVLLRPSRSAPRR